MLYLCLEFYGFDITKIIEDYKGKDLNEIFQDTRRKLAS